MALITSENNDTESLDDVGFDPVFIMGDHRSGTTLLYKLLSASGRFNVLTVYHHLFDSERLIKDYLTGTQAESRREIERKFAEMGLKDRVIDGLEVNPDLPEEYGFLISPDRRPQLKPGNLQCFRRLCQTVQYVAGNDRPLLLKNPWDYLNFLYVKSAFPDSRFIFVHRHPFRVISSQLNAMRSLLGARNPYVALIADWYSSLFEKPFQLGVARAMYSSGLGFRISRHHARRAADYFMRNVQRLKQEDYISVRYEDICSDPHAAIGGILDFLGLPDTAGIDYASQIHVREGPLCEELATNGSATKKKFVAYMNFFGYE